MNTMLREKADSNYTGYVLSWFDESHWTLREAVSLFKELKRIPHKITAFIHRDKIVKVWKSTCFKNPADDYYLILGKDGNMYEAGY